MLASICTSAEGRRPSGSGTARYLHPDVQTMLDAGTAFSAWWSVVGPERPPLGVIEGGKNVR
jgi:hypothetical protein